jgi:hypothetical protein
MMAVVMAVVVVVVEVWGCGEVELEVKAGTCW